MAVDFPFADGWIVMDQRPGQTMVAVICTIFGEVMIVWFGGVKMLAIDLHLNDVWLLGARVMALAEVRKYSN